MEGQSDQENLLQLMSLNFGGNANNLSYGPEDDPNQHFPGCQPNTVPLSQWIHLQKAPHNYVEFLAESSSFLENATGADMLETITSPICDIQSVCGVSEIQRELSFNNLGKACDYKPIDPSHYMDTLKVRFQNPQNEVALPHGLTSFEQQIVPQQNQTSLTQGPYDNTCNVSQVHPRVTITPSIPQSRRRFRSSLSRQRAAATDRNRRVRISERLRSLQELLPNSVEVGQAVVMEDVIDHIKFLQLQLKELTRSRLGGESTASPFIFLEGYGHYVLNEQMTSEPLEEMMGKLLEMNPLAASQLLESRGLYMMPMSLAEEQHQVS